MAGKWEAAPGRSCAAGAAPAAAARVTAVLVLLAVCLQTGAQTGGPAAGTQPSPADIAQRLATRFAVPVPNVAVHTATERRDRYDCRYASVAGYTPPLAVYVKAQTGDIVEVHYSWPGSLSGISIPPPNAGPPKMDEAAAERLARAAAQTCVDGIPDDHKLVETVLNASAGYYLLRWQKEANAIRLPDTIGVRVDAYHSRPIEVYHYVDPVTVSLEVKVGRENALRTAGKAVEHWLQPGESPRASLSVLEVAFRWGPGGAQFLWWRMNMDAAPTGRPLATVMVDAGSGKVVDVVPAGGEASAHARAGPPGSRLALVMGALAVLLVLSVLLLLAAGRRRGGGPRPDPRAGR